MSAPRVAKFSMPSALVVDEETTGKQATKNGGHVIAEEAKTGVIVEEQAKSSFLNAAASLLQRAERTELKKDKGEPRREDSSTSSRPALSSSLASEAPPKPAFMTGLLNDLRDNAGDERMMPTTRTGPSGRPTKPPPGQKDVSFTLHGGNLFNIDDILLAADEPDDHDSLLNDLDYDDEDYDQEEEEPQTVSGNADLSSLGRSTPEAPGRKDAGFTLHGGHLFGFDELGFDADDDDSIDDDLDDVLLELDNFRNLLENETETEAETEEDSDDSSDRSIDSGDSYVECYVRQIPSV